MSHRNLFGLLDNPLRFPGVLVELGAHCAAPRCGSWVLAVWLKRPLSSYEPNSLIEISSEYTPINLPSMRNSFGTDLNDVPTTVAASDFPTVYTGEGSNCESFQCLCPSASGSQQQPASSRVINPWQMLNVGSCGQLQRSGDSNVEKSLLKGNRYCEFGSVTHSEQERLLSERQNLQMENRRIFEELTMKSRLYQKSYAKDCFAIEELRRICHEETERAPQLRTDELYAQKNDEPSTVNQLLSQLQFL